MEGTSMIHNAANKNTVRTTARILQKCVFFILCCFMTTPLSVFAEQKPTEKTLIIYYSRTGNTKVIAQTIAKDIGADITEITEVSMDRNGLWGFAGAGYDAFLDRHSEIKPRKIELEPYETVIIATPIWSWNLATPIHTLLQTHHFGKQKLILVTTANIDIKKYDKFKDGSGNAVQNYLQGYLEKKRIKARKEITAATSNELAQFKGHIHIETKDKPGDALRAEGVQTAGKIRAFLASQ